MSCTNVKVRLLDRVSIIDDPLPASLVLPPEGGAGPTLAAVPPAVLVQQHVIFARDQLVVVAVLKFRANYWRRFANYEYKAELLLTFWNLLIYDRMVSEAQPKSVAQLRNAEIIMYKISVGQWFIEGYSFHPLQLEENVLNQLLRYKCLNDTAVAILSTFLWPLNDLQRLLSQWPQTLLHLVKKESFINFFTPTRTRSIRTTTLTCSDAAGNNTSDIAHVKSWSYNGLCTACMYMCVFLCLFYARIWNYLNLLLPVIAPYTLSWTWSTIPFHNISHTKS